MSRPNVLTSELVPLVAATLPVALSAMFAWSTMATMLASVSAGALWVVGVAAAAGVEAAAAESARRAESALFSCLAHAETRVAAQAAAIEVRRMTGRIGPPAVVVHDVRGASRGAQKTDSCAGPGPKRFSAPGHSRDVTGTRTAL